MINGVSIAVQSQAEAMASRGHEVLVITSSDRAYPYLSQNDNLIILRLRSFHNPMRVGQRAMLYPRRATLRALDDFQPEIIYTHEALQMGWVGAHYAQGARIPIVLTIPQLPWFAASYLPDLAGIRKITETVLWVYARWIARKMDSVITPTQTISTLFANKTGIRTHTLSYGIDLETFRPPLSPDTSDTLSASPGLALRHRRASHAVERRAPAPRR
jgi:glycosyltransferase involved in cell wall biosynthesis